MCSNLTVLPAAIMHLLEMQRYLYFYCAVGRQVLYHGRRVLLGLHTRGILPKDHLTAADGGHATRRAALRCQGNSMQLHGHGKLWVYSRRLHRAGQGGLLPKVHLNGCSSCLICIMSLSLAQNRAVSPSFEHINHDGPGIGFKQAVLPPCSTQQRDAQRNCTLSEELALI